ncbi:MAG: hypothetical protein OEM38_06525 [Gammaproteobacteria bacterium]|nr:hypothetical protein [Gammaproteobacteria bacterium]
MFHGLGLKQIIEQKVLRIFIMLIAISVLVSCSGEEEAFTITSYIKLKVVGTDDVAVTYTGTPETDPFITANYYTSSLKYLGMNIFFDKGWDDDAVDTDQYLWIFIPNGPSRIGTYDNTSTNIYVYYEDGDPSDDATRKYAVTTSAYALATVKIVGYGDVDESVDGTFDVTLCLIGLDTTACGDSANRVQLIGSFGVIRGEDNNNLN